MSNELTGSQLENIFQGENEDKWKYSFDPTEMNLTKEEVEEIDLEIDLLRENSNTDNARLFKQNITAIGKGSAEIIFRFLHKFYLNDPLQYNTVLNTLEALDSDLTRKIILYNAKNTTRDKTKKVCAELIGRLGLTRGADILIEYLEKPELFEAAAEGLFKLRHLKAVSPLAEAMAKLPKNDEEVREMAFRIAKGFRVFGGDAVEPLLRSYLNVRGAFKPIFTAAIVNIGEPAIPALVKLLRSPDTSKEAAITLGQMRNAAATDYFLDALEKGIGSRMFVIEALGRTGDERAVAPLMKMMDKITDPGILGQIILSLGSLRAYDADSLIRKYYNNYEDDLIKAYCCVYFAQTGHEEGLERLAYYAAKGKERVRIKVAKHLNRLKPRALQYLRPYLEEGTDVKETVNVLQCMEKFSLKGRDGRFSQAVLRLTNSEDERIRLHAYRALVSQFPGKQLVHWLVKGENDPSPKVRQVCRSLINQKVRGTGSLKRGRR